MIFSEAGINDLYVLEINKKEDFRIFFARSSGAQELEKHGLTDKLKEQTD